MSKQRLETFVDGIFAIAMTLLVLALNIPIICGPLSNTAVEDALYRLLRSFLTLILIFILLALFWNIHHRVFQRIKEVDTILVWINMTWRLFIVWFHFQPL